MEIIKVEYTYPCPVDNYMDGTREEPIKETYEGPDKLYLVVHKETGEFETVLRDFERFDGRPAPKDHEFVELDCAQYPLVAEVLSDYHANHKNDPDYLEIPGTKTIKTPEGYGEFEYEYPIHPDHLYCDKKSVYNWETGKVDLYRNHNIDIIGEVDWDMIRKMRNEMLAVSDAQYFALKEVDPAKAAELEAYRQALRDVPQKLTGIDILFVDSSFPKTTLVEL